MTRPCLDDDELLTLAQGRATDELWDHAGSCTLCGTLIAEAAAPSTALVTRARGYTLGRELARGGMGRVVHGVDHHLGRDVAIKLSTVDREHDARFQREIELTARLQHPNIIPIYDAGELDGAPFYAMRLVSGQRLDQWIARATTREARFGLLPNAIAVVDALAYAHRQGVIHRDLKPQNVLVGELGETVVIDWGLGKRIGAEEPALPAAPASDSTSTVAGTVFGTPAYMSPEQARGEPSDCRSDVYALGCLLFQTLTGERPHLGTATDVLEDLVGGATVDVERAADLPPELRAIIAKATAADPARRYADAGELAADLRRYQAGKLVGAHRYRWYQRVARGVRRHRLAVAVVATLLLSAATIGTVAIQRIVAERDRANTERAAATALLGFLVDDLPVKLRAIGQLEVLADAGLRLDAYYTAVTPARPDSTDDLVRLAEVRSLRGDIASRVGRSQEAATFADQALALARDAERRGDPTAREVLARLVLARGATLQQTGRGADAGQAFDEGLALLAALPATAPNRALRAKAEMRQAGLAFGDGRLDDVVRWLDAARTSLAASGPHDLVYEQSINAVEYLDAQRLFRIGDLPGARAHADGALAAARRAQQLAPWRPESHDTIARSQGMLGSIALAQGDLAAAERAIADEVAVQRTLRDLDPVNTASQAGLASALSNLADLHDQVPGTPTGEALRTEAVGLLGELGDRDPTNQSWAELEIQIRRDLGGAALDRAEAIAPRLPAPQRDCVLVDLARDRATGAVFVHDRAAALRHLDRAAALLAALPAPLPDCARFQPFDVLIDRAIATAPAARGPLLEQARAMATRLRAEGVEDSLAQALAQRIADAVAAP